MTSRRRFMVCAALIVLPLIAGRQSVGDQPMTDLVRQYTADREDLIGFYALPASSAWLDQRERFEKGWLAHLQSVNFDALDHDGKIDYVLLENVIGQALVRLSRQRVELAKIEHLITFRATIHALEESCRRGAAVDCRVAAAQVDALTREVKQLLDRVKKGNKAKPKPKDDSAPAEASGPELSTATDGQDISPLAVGQESAFRAAGTVSELQGTLRSWFAFYDGYQPEFSWWLRKPMEEANKQLEEYAKYLREEVALCKGKDEDPLLGEPIGAEALAAEIRRQFLPYSAEELIAIGQRQFDWCEAQMKRAARDMGLGDDWQAALAKVKGDFVPPGGQDALVAAIGREATEFVRQRDLVTVPPLCEETWRLTMISPQAMKTLPYAAYSGQKMMVAYAKDEMKNEDKLMAMRGNNRHFSRLVTPHELIPGHHLQWFYAARHNTHRDLFGTPFYSEGWALYWEIRLWDLGWAKTPEDRIGMLFWRMHRCARILVSLKFHLGQMTPPQMVDFLVKRVGHEKLGATSEVRRFISAPPLYQAAYMIGGLQFLSLHKELVGGGKMSERQFHDAVLKGNTMPVELVQASLLRLPLSRDAKPAWRFTEPK